MEAVEAGGLLVAACERQDLRFAEEPAVEGDAGRRTVGPEPVGHHHRRVAREIGE